MTVMIMVRCKYYHNESQLMADIIEPLAEPPTLFVKITLIFSCIIILSMIRTLIKEDNNEVNMVEINIYLG